MNGHHVRLVRCRVRVDEKRDLLLVVVLRGYAWRPVCSCGDDLGVHFSRRRALEAGRDHVIGGRHA